MSPPEQVPGKIGDAVSQAQTAADAGTAAKAYHAVVQAAAIAIQDSADALRTTQIIAGAAAGVALGQFLASGDARFLEALPHAGELVDKAIKDFAAVAAASAQMVKEFPAG